MTNNTENECDISVKINIKFEEQSNDQYKRRIEKCLKCISMCDHPADYISGCCECPINYHP